MENKKEIFVLCGAGHKGSVKIKRLEDRATCVEVECNLDFRPNGATLYLIGEEIAQIALKDSKTTAQVPFSSKCVQGCVVRSSAFTLFGGRGDKSEMLAKIERDRSRKSSENHSENQPKTAKNFTKNQHVKHDSQKPFHEDEAQTSNREKAGEHAEQPTPELPLEDPTLAELLSYTSNGAGVLKYSGDNFYLAIKPQLDEMFVCYKAEEKLNEAVENSSWVHIDCEDGYYVVGVLKNGNDPAYVCYGVPSKDQTDVPPELKNVCVWVPVSDGEIKGYWVIYQSATTGEIIK